jgi:acyl-CoA oxidase
VFATFEGDNTVLLQLVGKNLLTDHRDQFSALDPLGLATFFAGQMIGSLAERTAVGNALSGLAADLRPGRDDGAQLLDRDQQLRLLRWRHEHLLQGVARRLKRGIDARREPFEVLIDCQDHLQCAAEAWVDVAVLEAFADAVERCQDATLRPLLDRLCSLHALTRVQAERGWYQEHGRLTAARSKAVTKAVNALCAQLRPDAALLIEAFGVPATASSAAELKPAA